MAIFSEKKLSQALRARKLAFYLIFTNTSGRCPLRARNTIELCGEDCWTATQPQCVSRSKLNFRLRNLLPTSKTAVEATTANDTVCCQSMLET
jgi:hypothetical protein